MGLLLLSLLLLLLDGSSYVSGQVYYVKSSENQPCPPSHINCFTMYYYVANNYFNAGGGNSFTFLPGVHNLNSTLIIQDLNTLTMEGEGGGVIIQCSRINSGVSFINVSSLTITGLTFAQCGMEITPSFFNQTLSSHSKTFLSFTVSVWAGIFMNSITDLTFLNTTITYSTGYGLLGVNLHGNTLISGSNFTKNNHAILGATNCFLNPSLHCKGGNMMLLYTDLKYCPQTPLQYALTIKDTIFQGGVDAGITYQPFTGQGIYRNDVQLLGGAGLGLILMQSSYGLTVNVTDVTLDLNAAFVGANFYANVWDFVDNTTITITRTNITHGNNYERYTNNIYVAGSFTLAPGFFYLFGMIPFSERPPYTPICIASAKYESEVFQLQDVEMSYNEATLNSGGFMYSWPRTFFEFPRTITLDSVRAVGNNGDATFINFYLGPPQYGLDYKVFVSNSYFAENYYRNDASNGLETDNPQVYLLNSVQYIEFSNCTWFNNRVSSIRPLQSIVHFKGTNSFIGNSARTGGALNIREGSIVYFDTNSTTIFDNNFAEQYGGAIYAALASFLCFYQIEPIEPYPRLEFISNSALLAGDAVYSNLENCLLHEGVYTESALRIFNDISDFSLDAINSTSLISSPASQLCICDENGTANCEGSNFLQINTRPGQSVQLSLQGRGYLAGSTTFFGFGLTPTEITAKIEGNTSLATLSPLQYLQSIASHCSILTYTLYGRPLNNHTVRIVLSPNNLRLYTPVILNVTLLPCPIGFVLSNDTLECVCDPILSNNGVTCDSNELTVNSDSIEWIGTLNTTIPPLVAYGECQTFHHYCNTSRVTNLRLDNPDVQCIEHHSGVLCGQCQPGYSLAIGSTNCLKCSNSYLSLLIVFVATGLLIPAFLSFFNITVSTGRITAMLFYANVIKLENFQFFTLTHPGFAIFQIFIDWINLDFGIQTCFYDGFDIYVKSWLQFVYLLYIYAILITVVVSAQYSTRVSKIMPKNILGVVATVFLISYVKLLRSTVVAFPISKLYTNKGDEYVWSLDGSIPYAGTKHLPLFLFSLILTLCVIFPVALLMLLYPFIWSFSAHEGTMFEKVVCFVRGKLFKMKPFLETFDGPYSPNSRYWTGLLLLLRLVIYYTALSIPNTGSSSVLRSAAVTVICIVLLGLVIAFKIFNCKINRQVEFIHLLNLAVVQFVLLVMSLLNQSATVQGIALSISISIAFLIFLYTIVYENWNSIKKPYYRARGKTFVDVRAQNCQIAAKQRDMEFNERQNSKMDAETTDTNEFIDVIDARKTATRSSVSYQLNPVDEKLEQLKRELM